MVSRSTFIDPWINAANNNICLSNDDYSLTYSDVDRLSRSLDLPIKEGNLCLLGFGPSLAHCLVYIALVRQRCVPIILSPDTPREVIKYYVRKFQPNWIIGFPVDMELEHTFVRHESAVSELKNIQFFQTNCGDAHVNQRLAILLPTSGSTGGSKLVRLSHESIANCIEGIVDYQNLSSADVHTNALPLSYSYGLSVFHAQLASESKMIVDSLDFFSEDYWKRLETGNLTCLSMVPTQLDFLARLKNADFLPSRLRLLACAGGKLRASTLERCLKLCDTLNVEFYSMYGATEASPRMSFVPPSKAYEKLGSAGKAIRGGRFSLNRNNALGVSEIMFEGKNVALGYAYERGDLTKGDEFQGVLNTGDFGFLDNDDYLYIEGRIKRVAKAHGISVNLDELEEILGRSGSTIPCIAYEDKVIVFILSLDMKKVCVNSIKESTSIPLSSFKFLIIQEIPLNANKKVDYRSLEALIP